MDVTPPGLPKISGEGSWNVQPPQQYVLAAGVAQRVYDRTVNTTGDKRLALITIRNIGTGTVKCAYNMDVTVNNYHEGLAADSGVEKFNGGFLAVEDIPGRYKNDLKILSVISDAGTTIIVCKYYRTDVAF